MQPLAAQLPVIGNGESVGLLLDIADEGKNGLVVVNADLLPLGRHQSPGAVPVVFHHTKHRKLQPQFLQCRHGYIGMVYAAVDEQQVRGGFKALVP